MAVDGWRIEGATKDRQTITAQWEPTEQPLIDGVVVREVRNVPKSGGYLTEIVRGEWLGDNRAVDQIFQNVLEPGAISAWHAHEFSTDRLFVSHGMMRIVLFDRREGSATFGQLNHFRLGAVRPGLVIVPPGVWHGVQNVASTTSILINAVDRAYDYADPDHWRVPPDSPEIPFRFDAPR